MSGINGTELVDDLAFLGTKLEGCTLSPLEAVRAASAWWDATGRHLVSETANRESGDRTSVARGGGPMIRVKDKGDVVLPSKILQGHPWAELDRRERASIVKAWLSQYRQVHAVQPGPVIIQ